MGRPLVVLPFVLVALLGSATTAAAFCRTTNCVCKHPAPETHNLAPTESACPDECPKDENGCQIRGTPVAWKGKCVGFSMNLTGTSTLAPDQWKDALTQAFLAWGSVDCGGGKRPSINVMELRDVMCARSEYSPDGPNVNVVYFDDNGWGENKDIDGTLALTKVHFDSNGEILDADMAINSGRHDFTVGDDVIHQDLVSVATHEVGHFLGLDHSPNEDAVMYWTYDAGTKKRALTDDDVQAICTVYPPDRTAECDPVPRGGLESCNTSGGCTAASHESSTGTLLPFALTALGIAIGRFRASRKER